MRLVLLTIAVISIVAFAVVDGGAEFIKRAATALDLGNPLVGLVDNTAEMPEVLGG